MTSYQGGKQRLGKQIHQELIKWEQKLSPSSLAYLEPFCGMCGVMKHFAKEDKRVCYASDLNPDIIAMWKAIQKGWKPPEECTEEYYNELKNKRRAIT